MLNIEKIKAREQAATPGPWVVGNGSEKCGFNGANVIVAIKRGQPYVVMDRAIYPKETKFNKQVLADMKFAAHARADIPSLIAEVERLQKSNAAYSEENHGLYEQIATLKKALSEMLFAYQNKDADFPHQFEIEAVRQAQQLTHETRRKVPKPNCSNCKKLFGCQHRIFEPNNYEPCAEYEAQDQEADHA